MARFSSKAAAGLGTRAGDNGYKSAEGAALDSHGRKAVRGQKEISSERERCDISCYRRISMPALRPSGSLDGVLLRPCGCGYSMPRLRRTSALRNTWLAEATCE